MTGHHTTLINGINADVYTPDLPDGHTPPTLIHLTDGRWYHTDGPTPPHRISTKTAATIGAAIMTDDDYDTAFAH